MVKFNSWEEGYQALLMHECSRLAIAFQYRGSYDITLNEVWVCVRVAPCKGVDYTVQHCIQSINELDMLLTRCESSNYFFATRPMVPPHHKGFQIKNKKLKIWGW